MRSNKLLIGIAVVLLATLFLLQFLNHTGFCYQERRYLTERELVDKFLFNESYASMTLNHKVSALEKRDGSEYPGCCRVHKNPSWWTWPFAFLQNTLGHYHYGIDHSYPLPAKEITDKDTSHHFYTREISIDACGLESRPGPGIAISREEYESTIQANNKYWREMEK